MTGIFESLNISLPHPYTCVVIKYARSRKSCIMSRVRRFTRRRDGCSCSSGNSRNSSNSGCGSNVTAVPLAVQRTYKHVLNRSSISNSNGRDERLLLMRICRPGRKRHEEARRNFNRSYLPDMPHWLFLNISEQAFKTE